MNIIIISGISSVWESQRIQENPDKYLAQFYLVYDNKPQK